MGPHNIKMSHYFQPWFHLELYQDCQLLWGNCIAFRISVVLNLKEFTLCSLFGKPNLVKCPKFTQQFNYVGGW